MKIDDKMLHIPPYISTNWNHVKALYVKGGVLAVTLIDGDTVHVPNLPQEALEQIFAAHSAFLEQEEPSKETASFITFQTDPHPKLSQPTSFLTMPPEQNEETGFRLAFGAFDNFGMALQHNPAQTNYPDMPAEVLQKITAILKIVAPDEMGGIANPEPHCNCVHCQIARAVHGLSKEIPVEAKELTETDEEVSEQELQFQQWEIKQADDKLFHVTNRLDSKEQYNVYLGHPIGCTCGKQSCEHIVAVLKS